MNQSSWKEFLSDPLNRKDVLLEMKDVLGKKRFADFEEYIAFNKISEEKKKNIFVIPEQKQMHESILNRLEENNISKHLDNPISMEYYLQFYFEYASENKDYINDIFDKAYRRQSLRKNIRFSISISLFMIILCIVVCSIIDLMEKPDKKEQAETISYSQETVDKEIDDIIEKYNEWSTKEINNN